MAESVREKLERALTWESRLNKAEQLGAQGDGGWAEIKIQVHRERGEFTEALATLSEMERNHEAIREIQSAAREGLYDPMPDAITVEGALSQILVLTDAILDKKGETSG